MRVAHIITRMIVGGAQENTLHNCLDLQQIHGDDVLLLTGPATGPEGDLLQQGRAGGKNIERLEVAYLPAMRRNIHPYFDWQCYRQIRKALRAFRPDVVHTHSAKAGFLGRLAAHSLKTPAVIHTVHGAPFHAYQNAVTRGLFRACEKYAARRCHQLVSVADAMTQLMVEAGVAPAAKFTTVYSGMDVDPFLAADTLRDQTRRELGYTSGEVVIGKIARLYHLKGHKYLIEAASAVVQAAPHVRFLLIGDGVLRSDIERRIAAAGLQKYFQFTGLVPPAQIPALTAAIDILAHTSLREGLARALPQALIAGKPVVSYDIDGAREVVINNQTGYLLPPRSIQPLGNALIELAASETLRRRLGGQGRAMFTDQFRHQTMTATLRAIYEVVLAAS